MSFLLDMLVFRSVEVSSWLSVDHGSVPPSLPLFSDLLFLFAFGKSFYFRDLWQKVSQSQQEDGFHLV